MNYCEDPTVKKKYAWKRTLYFTLDSKLNTGKQLIFGQGTSKDFNISISGNKNLALAEDMGMITISNLEYAQILQIIDSQYYIIKIYAGYENSTFLLFSGEVSYIDQKPNPHRDVETHIYFASPLIASYSQKRMNFSLTSGINIWAAMNYICQTGGVKGSINVSEELKSKYINNFINEYGTANNALQTLNNTAGGSYLLTSDPSVTGNVIDCVKLSDKRVIKLDPNTLFVTHGMPTVSNESINLSVLATFNFVPGDIIHIDNAWIDLSIGSASAVTETFKTAYLDTQNNYIITALSYNLQNRGGAYEFKITARAVSQFQNITGAYVE